MRILKNLSPTAWVALLTGLWAVLNLATAAATDLMGDEAYYWVWSRDLAWGYFDHPPLVAALIRLGTSVFGDTELGVRFWTVLLHWGALNLLWRVVRTERSDRRSAWIYSLVVFSIPMLHLYGFITTPDVPLFFTMVLALWLFVRFSEPGASWGWAVALGAAVAAMGYSKYHGALATAALVLSNLKILRDRRFYVAAGVAAVLIVPHLMWQQAHDWVSFRFHLSERGDPFEWRYVEEYFLNLLGVYNPLLMVPFVWFLVRRWGKDGAVRAAYMLAAVTMLFFLYSTRRGDVQPQWLLPVVPGVVLFAVRRSEASERFGRYVLWGTGVFGVLLLAVRAVVFFGSEPIRTVDLWGSRAMIQKAERELGGVGLLVFEGNYATGSKFMFYGTIPVSVVPSLYSRSSQFQFVELDPRWAGLRTAYEVGDRGHREFSRDSLRSVCVGVRVPVYDTILFDTVSSYLPTTAVRISAMGLPVEAAKGEMLSFRLRVENPYPYAVEGVRPVMHVLLPYRGVRDAVLSDTVWSVPAGGAIEREVRTVWPVEEGARVGFSVQRLPLHGGWFNSPLYPIKNK